MRKLRFNVRDFMRKVRFDVRDCKIYEQFGALPGEGVEFASEVVIKVEVRDSMRLRRWRWRSCLKVV